jgi:hypothetical protein
VLAIYPTGFLNRSHFKKKEAESTGHIHLNRHQSFNIESKAEYALCGSATHKFNLLVITKKVKNEDPNVTPAVRRGTQLFLLSLSLLIHWQMLLIEKNIKLTSKFYG